MQLTNIEMGLFGVTSKRLLNKKNKNPEVKFTRKG